MASRGGMLVANTVIELLQSPVGALSEEGPAESQPRSGREFPESPRRGGASGRRSGNSKLVPRKFPGWGIRLFEVPPKGIH